MHLYETKKGDAAVKFCQETLKLDPVSYTHLTLPTSDLV